MNLHTTNQDVKKNDVQNIPEQIFEKFLEELETTGISSDIVGRLKEVILSEHTPNEQAIKVALFSDTQGL